MDFHFNFIVSFFSIFAKATLSALLRSQTALSQPLSLLPTGLKPNVDAFFLFALTMSLASLAAVALAFLVSASVGSFAMANILIALPYVFMMVR